jgi:hypothetical protein
LPSHEFELGKDLAAQINENAKTAKLPAETYLNWARCFVALADAGAVLDTLTLLRPAGLKREVFTGAYSYTVTLKPERLVVRASGLDDRKTCKLIDGNPVHWATWLHALEAISELEGWPFKA